MSDTEYQHLVLFIFPFNDKTGARFVWMCRCGGVGDHEHLLTDPGAVLTRSLFDYIDLEKCTVLNCANPDSLGKVISDRYVKTYSAFIASDTDDQMIVKVVFSAPVKIKALRLACLMDQSSPTSVSLFANQNVDFSSLTNCKATQKVDCLAPEFHRAEIIEYPLRPHLFANVNFLSILVENKNGERSKCAFIGFMGDFVAAKPSRSPIVVTQYELKPNPADHKAENDWQKAGHGGVGF